MSEQVYNVVKGTIQLPDFKGNISKGQLLPKGALKGADIERLLRLGYLKKASVETPSDIVPSTQSSNPKPGTSEQTAMDKLREQAKQEPIVTKGKWDRDPTSMEGLDLEQLLIAIVEIDPLVDVENMEENEARALLSSDFHPIFQEEISTATSDQIDEAARKAAAQSADGAH